MYVYVLYIHAHESYIISELVSNIIVWGTCCWISLIITVFCRTMTSFSRIDEIRPENESIEAYMERIEL